MSFDGCQRGSHMRCVRPSGTHNVKPLEHEGSVGGVSAEAGLGHGGQLRCSRAAGE